MGTDPVERLREVTSRMHGAPGNVVIAASQPMKKGQVLVVGGWRFAVERQLDRVEFERQSAYNERRRYEQEIEAGIAPQEASLGAFIAVCAAGRTSASRYALEPDAHQKYFYAMRRLK
jgi:hypothetical protein